MKTDEGALARFLRNNRWVLLLFLAGAVLLLLPSRPTEESKTVSVFTREEERLCAALPIPLLLFNWIRRISKCLPRKDFPGRKSETAV